MAGEGGFRWLAGDVLEIEGGPGLLWYADADFDDFTLEVAWRLLQPEGNSGVFLRCPPLIDDQQPAIEQGYEVQIDDRGLNPRTGELNHPLHLTGAIYELAPAVCRLSRPLGAWNGFEVFARGRSIAVALNGERVSMLENASRRSHGHVGLQAHHRGGLVQFRDLRIEPLSCQG